jgi:hypothetical protein
MAGDNSLFLLIKSLSPAERTYLRRNVFAGSGKRSDYIELFDAMEEHSRRTDTYDEFTVKKALENKNFSSHFAVTKNYLYDFVIESLYNYTERYDPEYKTRAYLKKTNVLIKKGLYSTAKKFLKKAQAEALKKDFYTELIEAAFLEKKISNVSSPADVKILEEKIISDIGYASERIINAATMNYLFKKLHSYLLENPVIRNREDEEFIKEFFNNPLLQNEEQAITFESRLNYYRIYMNYFHAANNPKEEFEYGSRLAEYIFENSGKITINPLNVYRIYLRFLITCLRAKKYSVFFTHLSKLRKIHSTYGIKLTKDIQLVIIESYGLEMNFYNNCGEFDKAVITAGRFENEFLELESSIHILSRFSFYYNIAVAYFGVGHYEKSLHWINKVINNARSAQSGERYFYSLILALIIHFELKNIGLTESLIRKIYRVLYKKNRPYEFEKLLMKFFRKLPDLKYDSELTDEFRFMQGEFKKLLANPYEKTAIEKFEFIEYLESKVTGKPFAEIYRAKVKHTG